MTTSRSPEPLQGAAVDIPAGHRETVAALFARRSVRRYAAEPVETTLINEVNESITRVRPLVADNSFTGRVSAIEGSSRQLASALGSYAAIVSARHLLAVGLAGTDKPLLDFGFRVEQLVIELTRLGLGSCWVGTLQHEEEARRLVGAGSKERVPAVVMFGKPSVGAGGKLVNRAMRTVVGATRRQSFSRFAFEGRYGNSFEPQGELRFILDCLRHAPSAGNARPWRVISRDEGLVYCVDENAGYYRLMKLARWGYPELDAGIGMAHINIALEALGHSGNWELFENGTSVTEDSRRVGQLRTELGLPDSVRPVGRMQVQSRSV